MTASWLQMLADAESALAGSEDDFEWAVTIPVPLLLEDLGDPEVQRLLAADPNVLRRWSAVKARAR